jgi:hypothetical protein
VKHRDIAVGGDPVHRERTVVGKDLILAGQVLEKGHGDVLAALHAHDVEALHRLDHTGLPETRQLRRAFDDVRVEDLGNDDVRNSCRSHVVSSLHGLAEIAVG